jgi:hypothetical protein
VPPADIRRLRNKEVRCVQTADIAAGLRLTGGDGSKCGLCYLENLRRCWGARERVKAKRKERDELGGGGGARGPPGPLCGPQELCAQACVYRSRHNC